MHKIPCGNSHNLIVSHVRVAGARHRRSRQPCEDVVLVRTAPDFLFCGLADGQTGTKYGAEGGRVCLEAVFDYIASVGIRSLLDAPFPDELPCTIVKRFRKRLLSLAESRSVSMKEFASTLLAVAVDLKTGSYVLLHLGDGCAISIPHTWEPFLSSMPENGISACHTWLTTSDTAVSHFRITFGALKEKKRLLLLSDGAACYCRGRDILWRTREFLKNGTQAQLQQRILESEPVDDATCVILDVCPDEPPATAP